MAARRLGMGGPSAPAKRALTSSLHIPSLPAVRQPRGSHVPAVGKREMPAASYHDMMVHRDVEQLPSSHQLIGYCPVLH